MERDFGVKLAVLMAVPPYTGKRLLGMERDFGGRPAEAKDVTP